MGVTACQEALLRLVEQGSGQSFAELAEKFVPMVDALNEISESSYQHSAQDRLRLYELWMKTGSERSRKLLRKLGLEPVPSARSILAH